MAVFQECNEKLFHVPHKEHPVLYQTSIKLLKGPLPPSDVSSSLSRPLKPFILTDSEEEVINMWISVRESLNYPYSHISELTWKLSIKVKSRSLMVTERKKDKQKNQK